MTQEEFNQKKDDLIERHIEILTSPEFRDNPRGFYLAVGPGWLEIVDTALTRFEKVADNDFYISDIKEKYGTLRFYEYGDVTPETDMIAALAEAESEQTCWHCGSEGQNRKGKTGWLLTVCDEHTVKTNNFEEMTKPSSDLPMTTIAIVDRESCKAVLSTRTGELLDIGTETIPTVNMPVFRAVFDSENGYGGSCLNTLLHSVTDEEAGNINLLIKKFQAIFNNIEEAA